MEVPQDKWELVSIDNDTTATRSSGTLNEDIETTFLNKKLVNLTVSKEVNGNMGDRSKDFNFTFKINAETTTKNLRLIYTEPGPRVTTTDGESIYVFDYPISGITTSIWPPTRVRVEIPEAEVTLTNGNKAYRIDMVTSGNWVAKIYNEATNEYLFDFDASKVNNFTMGSELSYTESTSDVPETIKYKKNNGDIQEVSLNNLSYSFTLKDSDTIEFIGLPYGIEVTVTENDYSNEGYHTYINNSSTEKRELSVTLTEDTDIKYTNKNNAVIPTKVTNTINISVILLIISIIGITVFRKKRGII